MTPPPQSATVRASRGSVEREEAPAAPGGPRRLRRAPRRLSADLAGALVGLGLGASVALALRGETASQLAAPGGVASFLGSLTGLVGTYLALVMVLLMSRIAPVERVIGQDGLARWHQKLAPWPISLLVAHALLITLGYAQAAKSGLGKEVATLLRSYPDVLAATVALGLMVAVAIASIRAVRRRLRYETWWVLHLYLYLALALAFAHELVLGPAFVGHPLTQAVWSFAWAATAGLVLVYRVGLPLARSVRFKLRVVEVRQEASDTYSVILAGRNLDRLAVEGGQFFIWRFLARDLWWQGHPYSLSALPAAGHLRLTARARGDHSRALSLLKPGTRVFVEGPYGAFTRYARQRDKALLIAGGIGVTAVRALLEDLPPQAAPVVVLRASSEEHLVFRDELALLVKERNGKLHELVGSRDDLPFDARSLKRLVPDITRRDVFVCGPDGFVDAVVSAAKRLGVAKDALHREAFSLS
jgi:predicted ferric reductase